MAFPFHPPTGSRDSALSKDSPIVARKGVGMKVELRYGAFDQDMNTKHGYVNFGMSWPVRMEIPIGFI